jgi:hypothetical protein
MNEIGGKNEEHSRSGSDHRRDFIDIWSWVREEESSGFDTALPADDHGSPFEHSGGWPGAA